MSKVSKKTNASKQPFLTGDTPLNRLCPCCHNIVTDSNKWMLLYDDSGFIGSIVCFDCFDILKTLDFDIGRAEDIVIWLKKADHDARERDLYGV